MLFSLGTTLKESGRDIDRETMRGGEREAEYERLRMNKR